LDLSPFPRQLVFLRWGLIPGWADDPAIGNRLINARAEGIAEKPAFRAAFRQRRCLVVADGFYEWRRSGRQRQPYFFHMRDDRPLGFAGLWESWEGPDHRAIESCTILTTAANELVRPVHDRMPVIVAPADYARWLGEEKGDSPHLPERPEGCFAQMGTVPFFRPESLLDLLRPYASEAMAASAVSPWVNSPAHDDPRCVEPAVEQ
jgi:putative SOS response-associated peptidase YedK